MRTLILPSWGWDGFLVMHSWIPRYTSKHPFETSSFVECRPWFLRKTLFLVAALFGFFSPSNRRRCATVGQFHDAPRPPYRILSSEQFVKDATRTETVETDSLFSDSRTQRGRMSQCTGGGGGPDLTVLFPSLLGFLKQPSSSSHF